MSKDSRRVRKGLKKALKGVRGMKRRSMFGLFGIILGYSAFRFAQKRRSDRELEKMKKEKREEMEKEKKIDIMSMERLNPTEIGRDCQEYTVDQDGVIRNEKGEIVLDIV